MWGAWGASWEDSNSSHQFTCSGMFLRHPVIQSCPSVR
jgi:hypothetical protein